jgi:large subunit ribosomal protein L10
MNRQEKETVIESLHDDLRTSTALFLVGVHGLSVSELQGLRRNLREHKGKLRFAKNTLVKQAVEPTLRPYLKNQVALVFASGEAPAVARVLWAASQENERMGLVAGYFESRVIASDMITFLATLPPKPVLVAQLCGAVQAPLTRLVGVLNMALVRLLLVVRAAAEK